MYIEVNTKFLGLQIDNHINWKNCVKQRIPKLSAACYVVRLMFHISNINTFKSISYAYVHSVIKYDTSFWGNSSNNGKIFTSQKKIVRIVAGVQPRTSCRSYLNNLRFYLYRK